MPLMGRGKGLRAMVSRRDFLRVGGLGVAGLSFAERVARARAQAGGSRRSCILIVMNGGPSQLETFDPKPNAPSRIRGPLKAIPTAVPGLFLSECLPRLAERAGQLSLIRSLYHDAAPIHETGLQLLQTGRLSTNSKRVPSFGSVVAQSLGVGDDMPPNVVVPQLISDTGVNVYRGDGAGFLGEEFAPVSLVASDQPEGSETARDMLKLETDEATLRPYGSSSFGRRLLQARQLVELGCRCVTVNLFDRLLGEVTFDAHSNAPSAPATLYDYRDTLGPQFDTALATLLDDLKERGILDETLVIATGEFGRSPYLNSAGGRDHWTGCWSALVAGGGVPGGSIIGASDAHAAAPIERPTHVAELTSTIYRHFGLESGTHLIPAAGAELPLAAHRSVAELVG